MLESGWKCFKLWKMVDGESVSALEAVVDFSYRPPGTQAIEPSHVTDESTVRQSGRIEAFATVSVPRSPSTGSRENMRSFLAYRMIYVFHPRMHRCISQR